MSDRLVIVPADREDFYDWVGSWADVVLRETSSDEEIMSAAEEFIRLPGPHRVIARKGPVLLRLMTILNDEYRISRGAWDYSVRPWEDPPETFTLSVICG